MERGVGCSRSGDISQELIEKCNKHEFGFPPHPTHLLQKRKLKFFSAVFRQNHFQKWLLCFEIIKISVLKLIWVTYVRVSLIWFGFSLCFGCLKIEKQIHNEPSCWRPQQSHQLHKKCFVFKTSIWKPAKKSKGQEYNKCRLHIDTNLMFILIVYDICRSMDV